MSESERVSERDRHREAEVCRRAHTSSTSEEARENKRGEVLVDKDKFDTFVIAVKFSMLCVSDCASDLSACACA